MGTWVFPNERKVELWQLSMSKEATSERDFTFSTLVIGLERIFEVYKQGETSVPVMPVISQGRLLFRLPPLLPSFAGRYQI